MQDTKGTTILAFVLKDAIIAGYDSRGCFLPKKNDSGGCAGDAKNIATDSAEKFLEIKGVYVAIAGSARSANQVVKAMQTWAKDQNTQSVKVSEVANVAEDYILNREWTEATSFALLIMGIEDGSPLVFAQKNCDLMNPKKIEVIGFNACKKEEVKCSIALGSGSRYVMEEIKRYNYNMSKEEVCDLAASIMLKASLFDPRTGGSIYVDYIDHNGLTSKKWLVPTLYLEKFKECLDWDMNAIFMLFIRQKSALGNELFQQWITSFSFIGEGDVLLSHVIGGFEADLLHNAILRRVVFRKRDMVYDLINSAVCDVEGKEYHVRWDGNKVHIRKPSKMILKYLLGLKKRKKRSA